MRVSISGETTAPLPPSAPSKPCRSTPGFNLRRDHRSLATGNALPTEAHHLLVSISGETTAPLPRKKKRNTEDASTVSISGETTAPLPQAICASSESRRTRFQSQARPPLPCHSHYCPE